MALAELPQIPKAMETKPKTKHIHCWTTTIVLGELPIR